jgi:serine/threonine-protein kinase
VRFLPGTVLAGRYRVIGLLGKGGMGEVYRADDLKLGQPVALKFLPAALADDPARLDRFLNEVKIARQVAHPNVCRVYDVGEAEGHHYLSMEYVDGEDLATLLKQIGRLPEDKAIQIARQLCAGLAATHELGILHRDLKPANVMLDGRGRVKLTDFGLAGLAEAFEGQEVRAGTPAYMSPEQAAGSEVSTRSDVYSLGLVLYELFTGRRAFDAGTLAELVQRKLDSTPPSPSSFMSAFDPTVERVLLQCLERDPGRRPAHALAVAAALPGGDPLAAALAAGETPSPEMVAAAGPPGGLRPGVALGCLAIVAVHWFASPIPFRSVNAFDHLPFVKPYEALQENARDIAQRLGYTDTPSDTWAGFGFDHLEYFHLIREYGPDSLVEYVNQPGQRFFWMQYRQDDGPILASGLTGRVRWSEPAPSAGDVSIQLDLRGRLSALRVTPSWQESDEDGREVDWTLLFELAGLDIELFEPAEVTIRPASFADTRMAWTGTLPDYRDRPVRIEAAALDGRPIAFHQIISSDPRWTVAGGQQPQVATELFVIAAVIFTLGAVLVAAGGLFLAVRNLRLGRGDRKGALRIAGFVFATRALHWALGGDHVAHPHLLVALGVAFCGATALALLTWIAYVACEPYVRRLWPESLVSWTRVLAGRFRDPLVGRDVLIGCTFASIQVFVLVWAFWTAERAGIVGLFPPEDSLIVLRGGRFVLGELFRIVLVSTAAALSLMMVFLLLRMICRRTWIAASILCLLWGALIGLQFAGVWGPQAGLFGLVFQATYLAVLVALLVRFGLFSTLVACLFGGLGELAIFSFDPTSPFFGTALFVTAVALAIPAYGCWIAMAGHPLMRDTLLKA